MTDAQAEIVRKLAAAAACGVEEWTKTEAFAGMDETRRIRYLAEKELLEWV